METAYRILYAYIYMQIHFMNSSGKCRSEAYLVNESYGTCLNGQDPQVLHHLMDTLAESDCIYQHTLTASLTPYNYGCDIQGVM